VPNVMAEIFRQAAAANRHDPHREGNVVVLEGGCEVLVTGDIHGNRTALAKVIAVAQLDGHPQRRLILQEIIHGPVDPRSGHDRSIDLLLRSARLKIAHPEQVFFILGNHDIAQVSGGEITKDGRRVCEQFLAGVGYACGDAAAEVLDGVKEFLLSVPLAVRCPGGVFICHSVPGPKRMARGGTEILRRAYTDADLQRGGPVYEWTWGRGHNPEQLEALAQQLGVEFFILGHRHTPCGWEQISPRGITIASDHEHGVLLQFPADTLLAAETVEQFVKPIAGIAP